MRHLLILPVICLSMSSWAEGRKAMTTTAKTIKTPTQTQNNIVVVAPAATANAGTEVVPEKEKPLNLTLSREKIREILAESDAIEAATAIRKAHHLDAHGFAQVVRDNGDFGTGRTFISLDIKDPYVIALAAATSLGLVVFNHDQEIMDYVQETKDKAPQGLEEFGNFLGSRVGSASVMAGSYFLGVVLEDNKLKKAGIIMLASGVATAMVTEAFKVTYGRSRPIKNQGPNEFYGTGKSFFSGHTSSAFSLATVFSEIYGDEYPVVPWIAYGVATVTAYARMTSKAHWGSDVLAGAIAGVLVTKVVYHFMDKKFTDSKGVQYLSFFPSYDPKKKSVSVAVNYIPKSWR